MREEWNFCTVSTIPSYMHQIFTTSPITLDMDQFCVDIQGFRNCLSEKTTACPNYLTERGSWMYSFLDSSIAYVCSSEGKATVTAMLNSPCNHDQTQVGNMTNTCMGEYFKAKHTFTQQNGLPTIRHRCEWIRQRDDCNLKGYRSVCGDDVGDFA